MGLGSIRKRLLGSAKKPAHAHRPRHAWRPRLEGLEERTVLSILFGNTPGLTVSDNNGPVLSASAFPERVVFWGNGWNIGGGPALRTQMINAISSINGSPYFESSLPGADLGQYRPGGSQSHPGALSFFNDTFASPGTTFTANDVAGMVNHEFPGQTGFYYFVIPDPNSTPVCGGCAAEHTFGTFGSNRYYFGFERNLASPSVDDLTYLYSHEVDESITDPDGTALQVNPRNPSAWNEIGDGEAQQYYYRLNNYAVQSYWSRADGKFTVPTGQRQNFFVSAGAPSSRVLTVNGDQIGPNDTITLDVSGGGVRVTLNGEVAQFDPGQIGSIVVNTLTGNDTVNVERTLAGVPVTINLGGGTDTVNISPAAHNLGNIQGTVTIHDGAGVDTLNVNDQSNAANSTYTMTSGTVQRSGSALINYIGGINFVNINGGSGSNVYSVSGTEPGWTTTLNTGNGSDTVNVEGSSFGTFTLNEGTGGVNVNVSPSARNLSNIQGTVTVNGGTAGFDGLVINDQGNAAAQTYTLNANSMSRSGSGTININNLVNVVTLNGGNGANTYNVNNTNSFSATTLNTGTGNDTVNVTATTQSLAVNAQGSGNDTFNVSPVAHNLSNIQGTLTLTGNAGIDTLNANDQANAANSTYSLTATSFGRTGAAAIVLTNQLSYVVLNGGAGADTYNVTGTPPTFGTNTLNLGNGGNTVNIQATSSNAGLFVNTGAGADRVVLGSAAHTLDAIGPVSVTDASGTSAVVVDDSGFGGAEDYAVNSNIVTIARSAVFGLSYFGVGSLTLNGGSGGETYDLDSTSAPTTVNGGAGVNCFHVSPFTQYLAGSIGGPLALAGSGADVLDFFDANDPGAETYSFDAVPSTLTLGSTGGTIATFSGMTSIYVVTNGISTPDDMSGTVIFDPAGGPPCLPGGGPGGSPSRSAPVAAPPAQEVPVGKMQPVGMQPAESLIHDRLSAAAADPLSIVDEVFRLMK